MSEIDEFFPKDMKEIDEDSIFRNIPKRLDSTKFLQATQNESSYLSKEETQMRRTLKIYYLDF